MNRFIHILTYLSICWPIYPSTYLIISYVSVVVLLLDPFRV